MSLLDRIFQPRGQADARHDATAGRAGETQLLPSAQRSLIITREMLDQLFPIRNLDHETLDAFALDRVAEVCGKGSVLFCRGQPIESVIYLLSGTVRMELTDASDYDIQAGTAKANFPLSCGAVHSATARALTDVQFLRVSPRIMLSTETDQDHEALLDPTHPAIPQALRDSKLFQAFCQSYADDALVIPSMPDVAKKLRHAIAGDVGLGEIVRIIHLDPVIAARLVHVANSPLFLPTEPVNSCLDAVKRLGLSATRNLVVGLSLRHVYECHRVEVKKLMQSVWRQSIYLSSLCYVLASENRGVDSGEALLAGLIAYIGAVPFLYFAEKIPRELFEPSELDAALSVVRGPIGARILRDWGFCDELVEVPIILENWFLNRGDTLTLADIVILSNLHAHIGSPRISGVPAINAIPACGKLKDDALSPEHSLAVLHNAKDRIQEAMKFFEG